MEFLTTVIIVIAVVVVGIFVVVAVRRRDSSVQAAVEAAVSRVAGEAREAFDSRLATGKAELEQRHRAIDEQVQGFSNQVETIRTTLSSLQTSAANQHGSIKAQLKTAIEKTSELDQTTRQLARLLSNPTARGKWGERMAEDILRVVGMKEGISYLKQTKLPSGKVPDYTFLLPKSEKLHMDVKFPLSAYSEYLDASSNNVRDEAVRKLREAVRKDVTSLVGREGYLDSQETIDCVLMFIPHDGVYAAIHEHCRDQVDGALEQGVLICSPSTLLAVLVIVRKAMDTFALERSAQEILDVLGTFETQWSKFTEAIETVSSRADSLKRSVDQLMPGGTRRNMLEKQLGKIDHLRESRALNSDDREELEAGLARSVS